MTSSKFNFIVLIIFLDIRRGDLNILHLFLNIESISWHGKSISKWSFHISVKLSSEAISINDSNDSLKEVNILSNIEINPFIELFRSVDFFRDFLSLYKDTLGDTRILLSRLIDMNCSFLLKKIIIMIIII
jgi:hypothetical protein